MKHFFSLLVLTLFFSAKSFALGPLVGTYGACVGDSSFIHEMDTTLVGGIFSSSNPAVATVSPYGGYPGTFVTGVSAGTAVITYTYGGSYVTAVFTISPTPASITGITTICTGSATTLSDAVPGGIWSSANPGRATAGSATGLVTGVSAGTTGIYYTTGTGCYATTTFTVNATYTGGISGPSEVCLGSTMTLISTDSFMSGTWSSSNTSIATIGTSGVVSGITTGSVTISYTASGICGTASATKVVTVSNTTSPGTISGPSSIDVGAIGYFTESVPGGIWSIMAPLIATIGSSSGVVSGSTTGTDIITYTVSGCGGTATTTAPVDIVSFDGISGHVLFGGLTLSGFVSVWLIHFDPSTNLLTAIDSATVFSSGGSAYYQFLGLATDSFRIKAACNCSDSTGMTGYIPTYHTSSFYWYDATVIGHTAGSYDINQDINMAYGTVTSGPGFIAGSVLTGANKGTSGGAPAVDLHICVVNSATSQIIQQTHTNSAGNYSFSNLPVGQTYYVFPDSLNYRTTSYSGIKLTSSSPSNSSANFGMHTLSKTILPVVTGIANINETNSSVIVFPNPTIGKLNIQWNVASAETATVSVSDIAGHTVFVSTLNMTQGTGTSQIELTGLTNGTYLISVKSATISYNNKIELAH